MIFDLPTATIANLLSPEWQAARCYMFSNSTGAALAYTIAFSFPDPNGAIRYGYSTPAVHRLNDLHDADSLEAAQSHAGNRISPLFALRGAEVYAFLTAVNAGASLSDWRNTFVPTLTTDHHLAPIFIPDAGKNAVAFRWRSDQIVTQRYWLRWENGELQFTDRERALVVTDSSSLPFAQYACQVVVTEDGLHRVALLYEVNGEAVTTETQSAYLTALSQYDIPVLGYKKAPKAGRAASPRFRQWQDYLIVQANPEGEWASTRIQKGI